MNFILEHWASSTVEREAKDKIEEVNNYHPYLCPLLRYVSKGKLNVQWEAD